MTWKELRHEALRSYYPALFFERIVPHWLRRRLYNFVRGLALTLFLLALLFFGAAQTTVEPNIAAAAPKAIGLFLICLSIWMIASAFQAFFFSYYFRDIPDRRTDSKPMVSFELARMLYRTRSRDILRGFLSTNEGRFVLRRSGIYARSLKEYFNSRKTVLTANSIAFPSMPQVTFTDYAEKIFDADQEFSQFLFEHKVQKKDFLAICDWIVERETVRKHKERWWSRERLARIPGIGKSWSYGQTYLLDMYSRDIPAPSADIYEVHDLPGTAELKELEEILIRNNEANAFLVGDDIEGKLELISRLQAMIDDGSVFPQLEHKRIVMFDTDVLTSKVQQKGEFESELLKIMKEAVQAGNLILVFSDFPAFLASAQAMGTDVASLIDPYLTAQELQIIGLADTSRFHSVLERNSALMQRFDKVLMEDVGESSTIRILENEIIPLEKKHKLLFTYQSLVAVAEGAERYVTTGLMPGRAIDLLYQVASELAVRGRRVVRPEDVLAMVKTKTGIPVGAIESGERDILLNLEKILHHRIIGQDEAVEAIANAVRRARSGINNPSRPLASFLFLGPTGVGKTETTKALAEVFFGTEARIERLDMSEYAGADAVPKLIGSYETEKQGILSSMIREHPYGVLLLDEFEKTTPEVMNLFLQILDEGFFTDIDGKHVNARNLLIIATSNAGSELIWDAVKKGENLSHAKEILIDSIIHASIMKPELINRFDGVIIFHPLGREHLEKIARLQLERLQKRIAERGLYLQITDDLIKYVVKHGTDPKFGARPMNRAIQDKIEQIIAEKLIRGEVKTGQKILISQGDLA